MKTIRKLPLTLACITLSWIGIGACLAVVRELRAQVGEMQKRLDRVESRPRAIVTVNERGQLEVKTDGDSNDSGRDGHGSQVGDVDRER